MWGSLLVGLLARLWAREVAGFALVALTITLFIINLRRTAERAGRATERLEQLERNDAIQRQMLEAASRRPRSRDELAERLRKCGAALKEIGALGRQPGSVAAGSTAGKRNLPAVSA